MIALPFSAVGRTNFEAAGGAANSLLQSRRGRPGRDRPEGRGMLGRRSVPSFRWFRFAAHGRGVAMVLDPFLVLAQLLIDPIQGPIDGRAEFLRALGGDEIVLVLRGNKKFDVLVVTGDVDDHLDHHESVKMVLESHKLLTDLLLMFIAEVPVTRGDLGLHENRS
jgi:hypothetical protein